MKIVYLEKAETGSTQDDARHWLETNNLETNSGECVWVRTHQQNQGRGRQGRVWQAHPNDLIVSCGLRLPPVLRHRPLISLAAGHALYQALASLSPLPQSLFLKWPNDLFWMDPSSGPRKLGGILAESFKQDALVVGWGLNLQGSRQSLQTTGGYQAASFEEATGAILSAPEVLSALQTEFLDHIQKWQENPTIFEHTLVDSLRQGAMAPLWGLSGRLSQGNLSAIARDLNPSGALLIEVEGEPSLRPVLSGEFTFFV